MHYTYAVLKCLIAGSAYTRRLVAKWLKRVQKMRGTGWGTAYINFIDYACSSDFSMSYYDTMGCIRDCFVGK